MQQSELIKDTQRLCTQIPPSHIFFIYPFFISCPALLLPPVSFPFSCSSLSSLPSSLIYPSILKFLPFCFFLFFSFLLEVLSPKFLGHKYHESKDFFYFSFPLFPYHHVPHHLVMTLDVPLPFTLHRISVPLLLTANFLFLFVRFPVPRFPRLLFLSLSPFISLFPDCSWLIISCRVGIRFSSVSSLAEKKSPSSCHGHICKYYNL